MAINFSSLIIEVWLWPQKQHVFLVMLLPPKYPSDDFVVDQGMIMIFFQKHVHNALLFFPLLSKVVSVLVLTMTIIDQKLDIPDLWSFQASSTKILMHHHSVYNQLLEFDHGISMGCFMIVSFWYFHLTSLILTKFCQISVMLLIIHRSK